MSNWRSYPELLGSFQDKIRILFGSYPESPGYPSGSYPELVECTRLIQMELRWQIGNPMVPAKMEHRSTQTWICLRSHQKFDEAYFRDEIHDES